MVHSRTIREAAAHFREVDPNTSLTETAIRNLLRQGLVPCARVGRKYLVTIEALEAYLMGDTGKTREKPQKAKKPSKKWQIR
ncbi:MAG: helix-turn-helix domain-containing protein [Oscillospiraceae bacterium]|nr:helix-turn-helix domain-containing protein [Oscillospiraceae bacterium]